MSNPKQNRFKGLMQVIRQESAAPDAQEDETDSPEGKKEQSNAESFPEQPTVIWVPHKKIHRDLGQSRRYFDPDELNNMAASMKAVGVIDPLSVRLRPGTSDEYDLLAGEKRHRSAEIAGLEKVPVRFFEVDDQIAEDIKAISNLQRSDLNKWEETNAIMGMLCRNLGKTQAEVISLLNQAANQKRGLTDNVVRSEDWIAVEEIFTVVGRLTPESFRKHRVPLIKLPEHIQAVLQQGKLHYTKVNEVLKVKDTNQQRQLLELAISQELSVSEIQAEVKTLRQAKVPLDVAEPDEIPLPQRLTIVTQQLKKAKVWNDPKKKRRLEKLLAELGSLITE
ncbi:ParB/RepB/Spo0J family partition protein (plasmid) [Phormidium sp. CLA17]|uniref:ParB/RepB/Spo0J family partition protein n=1 Tax=Leptolyngbya sp. Cla-17 TaxID=2803751 RepID=UPI001492CBE6|nr:ParB/RepB/Spo0J family partition protein [Leptolyngbya sp. Cla-17]MBM0745387.1 ParB/RepB/Spo0J family partition protein [Leptolyngbya sp. Cla-17]